MIYIHFYNDKLLKTNNILERYLLMESSYVTICLGFVFSFTWFISVVNTYFTIYVRTLMLIYSL